MSQGESFKFPDCWQDDMRMNSLFAPVRAKSINPTDWETKLKFWANLIEQWCLFHKTPLIQIQDLINHFHRNGREPSCILEVIEHLQRENTFISKNAFYQKTETSWIHWAVRAMAVNPLQWALGNIKNTLVADNRKSEFLVHWPTVKILGQEILNQVPEDCKGVLLDISYVQKISGIKSIKSLELIMQWLFSQKSIALNNLTSNTLIKFPRKNDENIITDIDMAYYSIDQKKRMLQKNMNCLEEKRNTLLQEAKKHLAAKDILLAKKCLRRKKAVENLLQKVGSGMENIENLLKEMRMAEMNHLVLECYKIGVNSLKNYFKENGMTVEKVMSATNEVEEVLIFANKINAGLSETGNNADLDESNEDLEEELSRLLQGDQKTNNPSTLPDSDSILNNLPEVPSESLNVSFDKNLEKQLANLAL